MDIIKKNNHKPQFVIKMILPLKICCSVHEFKLLLNLLDIYIPIVHVLYGHGIRGGHGEYK
jgi:hypothetical protein